MQMYIHMPCTPIHSALITDQPCAGPNFISPCCVHLRFFRIKIADSKSGNLFAKQKYNDDTGMGIGTNAVCKLQFVNVYSRSLLGCWLNLIPVQYIFPKHRSRFQFIREVLHSNILSNYSKSLPFIPSTFQTSTAVSSCKQNMKGSI